MITLVEERESSAPIRDVKMIDSIPLVPQSVFYGSLLVALTALLAMGNEQGTTKWSPTVKWADVLSYWLDPVLVQGISIVLVTLIIMAYRYQNESLLYSIRYRYISLAATFTLVLLPLVGTYLLEIYWLKPGFGYDRPGAFNRDSWLTQWLGLTIDSHDTACPSGFALRESWLLVLGFAFASTKSRTAPHRYYSMWRLSTAGLLGLLTIACAVIGFVRIARHAHTPFDVAMGIALGVYMFWIFYFSAASMRGLELWDYGTDLLAVSAIFIPIFLFYARHTVEWAIPAACLLYLASLSSRLAHLVQKINPLK